ncbi:MAG TPA: hypothetical protein VFA76_09560 [Terriglobales bacterium]|nr:hypothetical protein [Terriglobales bacterium]
MEEVHTDDLKRKRFLWGVALAWLPSLPFFLFGVYNAFKGMESQKATGLGAVAGGWSEVLCTVGLATVFIVPATAIVLLTRSFSTGHGTRKMLSLLSIAWCALLLSLAGFFVWLFFFHMHTDFR